MEFFKDLSEIWAFAKAHPLLGPVFLAVYIMVHSVLHRFYGWFYSQLARRAGPIMRPSQAFIKWIVNNRALSFVMVVAIYCLIVVVGAQFNQHPSAQTGLPVSPPPPPQSEQTTQTLRDPDGIYQFEKLVGKVVLPYPPDLASGTISFGAIQDAQDLNVGKDFEYRDFILHLKSSHSRGVIGFMGHAVSVVYRDAVCEIVGRK